MSAASRATARRVCILGIVGRGSYHSNQPGAPSPRRAALSSHRPAAPRMSTPHRPRLLVLPLCLASLLFLGCAATKERIPTIGPGIPTPEGAPAPVSHMGMWYVELVTGRG